MSRLLRGIGPGRGLVPPVLLALVLASAASGGGAGSEPARGRQDELLARILEKAGNYCRHLGGASLDFICRERIDERQYDPPLQLFSNLDRQGRKVTRMSLEYDYQLVRKGEAIEEKRVLLKENGKPRNEPDAVLKTKLYKHKNLVFGPGGLLSEYWQPRHSYALLGQEEIGGDAAFVLEAAPAGSPEPDMIYGKAWIRQTDFAIVKIEWDPRCLGNYGMIKATAAAIGHQAEPRVSVACSYGVEKNGIRFPDRMTIREEYWSPRGTFRVSETTVAYGEYRFFVVETEVRY